MSLVHHGTVGATTMHRLTLERVERAAGVIDPVFLCTPQFICEPLGDELGIRLALKVETLNPIRSFKGRGADLLVAQVAPGTPLVCASLGARKHQDFKAPSITGWIEDTLKML
jgi:threonine dehydratase